MITSNFETEDILEKERTAANPDQFTWKLTDIGITINAV